MKPYTKAQNRWRFRSRESGDQHRNKALELYWELHCDPISDEYSPDEVSAEELLGIWLESDYPDRDAERAFGPGMVRVGWFIDGDIKLEGAPFGATVSAYRSLRTDFLSWLTTPVNEVTGESVNWLRLPVVDKLWNRRRADKGGFIQQATGWKPSPYQPCVHMPSLLAASGLGGVPYQPVTIGGTE